MASPSSDLIRKIIDHCYENRIFAWRASSTGVPDPKAARLRAAAKKGVSDILALAPPNGRLLAIEVKIGSDSLRPEQRGFLKTVEAFGGLTFVAKDLDSFKVWLAGIIKS